MNEMLSQSILLAGFAPHGVVCSVFVSSHPVSDCMTSSSTCTPASPLDVAKAGLHKLLRGAAVDLDPLVSQITSALDSCSLIVSAVTRHAGPREAASRSSLIHTIKYAAEASSYQLLDAVSEP